MRPFAILRHFASLVSLAAMSGKLIQNEDQRFSRYNQLPFRSTPWLLTCMYPLVLSSSVAERSSSPDSKKMEKKCFCVCGCPILLIHSNCATCGAARPQGEVLFARHTLILHLISLVVAMQATALSRRSEMDTESLAFNAITLFLFHVSDPTAQTRVETHCQQRLHQRCRDGSRRQLHQQLRQPWNEYK
jgi:hypothetical protein